MVSPVTILPVAGLPEIRPGDDLAALIWSALTAASGATAQGDTAQGATAQGGGPPPGGPAHGTTPPPDGPAHGTTPPGGAPLPGHPAGTAATAAPAPPGLLDGDVVVVTQKVVSKAEGRLVDLRTVEPSPFARDWARRHGKDPRETEVVLRESARVVKMAGPILICETHHGLICANAGVDRSNVDGEVACLLPADPDASARRLRDGLMARSGATVAVIIADTFGRPWRMGQTNVAIGLAGLAALADYRGQTDVFGRELRVSMLAVADELAAAAELVMGKTAGVPVAVIRGYPWTLAADTARSLIRSPGEDLFR